MAERRLWVDISLILFLAVFLLILYQLSHIVKSDSFACYKSPLTYAANKLGKANNADFIGTGYFLKQGSPTVNFDKNNVTVIYQTSNLPALPLDLQTNKDYFKR